MVTINQKIGNMAKDGSFAPVMHQHKLLVNEDAGPFKKDSIVTCFIAEYDNERFAVWDTDWHFHDRYKVFNKEDLHRIFSEQ